jgi:dienelactone hydrolase
MKLWHYLVILLAVVSAVFVWKREPVMLAYAASKISKTSLEDRISLIEGAVEIRLPEGGAAPYPVVLQFHGCAGVDVPFHHQWADVANSAGYAAMIVDSTGPRGFSRQNALDIVCQGKALLGQERAGDVLAAINLAEADPRLDAKRIILAGWSHGGWTVMDYLTMDFKRRWPAGLKHKAEQPPAIKGVILFYPYCGPGALSRFRHWRGQPEVLALIAGSDTIVDAAQCISYFERKKRAGDVVDMMIYPDAEHVFDDPFLDADYIDWYNEQYANDAMVRYSTFLQRLKASSAL